jgi:hypothetical protein
MANNGMALCFLLVVRMMGRKVIFPLLGEFAKLGIATINFVVSLRPNVTRFPLEDFHEIWYLIIFQKNVEKVQVSLKSDVNIGYFT